MQYLRTTIYTADNQLTGVVACDDLALSPDEYKQHMLKSAPAPAFIAFDQFEHDGDLMAAVAVGHERWGVAGEDELNQAISYHWNGEMLARARYVLMNPAPAPLSVEQVKEVLEQLALHPNYAGQQVIYFVLDDNKNMTEITMKDGEVSWVKKGQG